jgi:hypothetical protein
MISGWGTVWAAHPLFWGAIVLHSFVFFLSFLANNMKLFWEYELHIERWNVSHFDGIGGGPENG